MFKNVRFAVCAVAISVIAASPGSGRPFSISLMAAPSLIDLRSPDELKTLFNKDGGKVRLVLLVSPT
jgi:hypothetical protein